MPSRKKDPLLALRVAVGYVVENHDDRSLTVRQLAVLLVCANAPQPPTVLSFSHDLQIPDLAAIRALRRLERERFIKRTADPSDRRRVRVVLTKRGADFVARLGFAMAPRASKRRRRARYH